MIGFLILYWLLDSEKLHLVRSVIVMRSLIIISHVPWEHIPTLYSVELEDAHHARQVPYKFLSGRLLALVVLKKNGQTYKQKTKKCLC